MTQNILVTAAGQDRPGLANLLSHAIKNAGGNIETQRAAHVADAFAVIVLFTVDSALAPSALLALETLQKDFFFLHARPADAQASETGTGSSQAELIASGADQPGVLDAVTQTLLEREVNIEAMDFDTESAPMTGQPLFRMNARISLPPATDRDGLRDALRALEDEYNFDVLLRMV